MTRRDEILTEIAALKVQLEQERTAITAQIKIDRLVNEGGEGYDAASALSDRTWQVTNRRILDLNLELFPIEWTAEVFAARRQEWNAEIKKLGAAIVPAELNALTARLGYGVEDLRKAKSLLRVN